MVHWDLPRTPVSALLLARLGLELGMSADEVLRGTRLRLGNLEDPHAEVGARQELTIIGNLVDAVADPAGLGLSAGVRYHLTAYGLWSFMLISSPTPRSAVEVALRYVDLTFSFCSITAREADGAMELVLEADEVPERLRRFVVEREAAAIRTIQREAFGETFELRQVRFALPAPADPAATELFGLTPEYDADEHVLVFDGSRLDDPMPQANEHTAAIAQAQCRELLERRRARVGLAGQVRDLLVGRLTDPPDAEEVAGLLHLSVRSLQRRLAADGTSLRALLDEVREQLAEELLVTGGLPVAAVAHRLGYVEVSSFSQAFRRWKGLGPRAYRTQAAQPG